eukprot:TRINITY_DN2364_c0_g1_i1.p1 TRINITY_DN2364_c0_g1~~TRINITY_DN2364_c0_g1_i1.p1  ORF type:complete len:1144 (-),score=226.01 TRINITY_DN2364_c0_g1_i1:221-3652(-)
MAREGTYQMSLSPQGMEESGLEESSSDSDQRLPFIEEPRELGTQRWKFGIKATIGLLCLAGLCGTIYSSKAKPRVRGSSQGLMAVSAKFAEAMQPGSAANMGEVIPQDASSVPVATPIDAARTIGNPHGFETFSSPSEAFKAMDANSDGSLEVNRDGLNRYANSTPAAADGVSKDEFKAEAKAEAQAEVLAEGPSVAAVKSRYTALKKTAPKAGFGPPEAAKLFDPAEAREKRHVDSLYTFGAPATSHEGLYDRTRPNGCFKGVRAYTQSARYSPGSGAFYVVTDPVAWLCGWFGFRHARMKAMATKDYSLEQKLEPCASDSSNKGNSLNTPKSDNFWWIPGHSVYEQVLQEHTDQGAPSAPPSEGLEATIAATAPESLSLVMSHFSFMNYEDAQIIYADAQDHGWNFVGSACGNRNKISVGCKDRVALFQEPTSRDCVLAFQGSADFYDWMDNLNLVPGDWCGFKNVHQGFKNHLVHMLESWDYSQVIKPRLSKCNKLAVTGHSLGGAQAELFSACANQELTVNDHGFHDYFLSSFIRGEPEKMPSFLDNQVEDGVFLKNQAAGVETGRDMCLDVSGTMASAYRKNLIMYPCEMGKMEFAKEQRWTLKDGQIVNHLSGFCLNAVPSEANATDFTVVQQSCVGLANGPSGRWEVTPEGFLKNLGFSQPDKCLDASMKLIECPYTDQKWELFETLPGQNRKQLRNTLSGKCLDVYGNDPKEGYKLKLWPCETTTNESATDQIWDWDPEGRHGKMMLKNRKSQLCMNVVNQRGKENTPKLALAKCDNSPENQLEFEPLQIGPGHGDVAFLRHVKSGKCLDVGGKPGTKKVAGKPGEPGTTGKPGTADGSDIELATCENKRVLSTAVWKVNSETGFIKNVGTDSKTRQQCLTVAGRMINNLNTKEGDKIILKGCKFNTDQRWQFAERGYIKSVIGGQKCIDKKDGVSNSLELMMCADWRQAGNWPFLKWEKLADGKLRSVGNGKCLAVKEDITGRGAVTMLPCKDRESPSWTLDAEGFMVSGFSGKCLDVEGGSVTTDNAPLIEYACNRGNPNTDQKWQWNEAGFLVNKLSGKCMMPMTGTAIMVLKACPDKEQRWSYNATSGHLMNIRTGRCVDYKVQAPWFDVVEADCVDDRPEQKWTKVAGAS